MPLPGYVDYQRREYCKAIRCPVQLELESVPQGSAEYQKIRDRCVTSCVHTTYEFHHWLIERGYFVVRPAQ
jgi:hypothetical protein